MNALNAYNRLNANVAGMKKASEKLSSGYRINRAGDDAAGLAISEKMRSQIKGLNQAIRNSQDGINMIQTFEGAAQETHSILQRMKELAVESANGTYDNATDRAAIQLEFDQLNDELNQIADTDYNGTIVLNGGEMSDGLKAIDGEFNYEATTAANDPVDFSADPKNLHIMAANGRYDADKANAVWDKLGLDVEKNKTANVTFKFDGKNWNAVAVTDENGKLIDGAKASELKTTASSVNNNTGKGGFNIDAADVNVVFDAMGAKDGDFVTISFTNDVNQVYAPNNIDFKEAGTLGANDTDSGLPKEILKDMNVTLAAGVTDEAMKNDPALKEALDALNDASFKLTFDNGAVDTGLGTVGFTMTDASNKLSIVAGTDGIKVQYNDGAGNAQDLAVITLKGDVKAGTVNVADTAGTPAQAATQDTAASTYTGDIGFDATRVDETKVAKGTSVTITLDSTGTGTKLFDGTTEIAAADLAKYGITGTITVGVGNNGQTIVIKGATDAVPGTGAMGPATGDLNFGINTDAYNNAIASVDVHSIATPEAAKTAGGSTVSTSDAFGQSKGRLTYTSDITLQTGARTKDAVKFTFKYNVADMGELAANLDLSSRGNGLATANLSLANAKDANYAIDQIDKAINKTSMVRATFGSIQNRLEHKITNLTTTSENLTEAESSIRDTDMASEMMNYTKYNILQQAAQSMLAQANQQPQSILQLLG